jgi:hypothetical protein
MPTPMMLPITKAVDWGNPNLEVEAVGVVGVGGDGVGWPVS